MKELFQGVRILPIGNRVYFNGENTLTIRSTSISRVRQEGFFKSGGLSKARKNRVKAYRIDIAGLVPDHCNKASITIM